MLGTNIARESTQTNCVSLSVAGGHPCQHAQPHTIGVVVRSTPLFAPLYAKTITLPRQARDKHGESTSKTRGVFRREENGEWRQWEAYDCVNVDSVHNDGERHIPYISIFPNSTRNKLTAWGKAQVAGQLCFILKLPAEDDHLNLPRRAPDIDMQE
jgi:hypothetical protein